MNDIVNEMFRSMFGFSRRDHFPESNPSFPDHDSHSGDGFPGGGFPGGGFPGGGFPEGGVQFFFSPPFSDEAHPGNHDGDPHEFGQPTDPFGSGFSNILGQFKQMFEGLRLDDFSQFPRGESHVFSIGPGQHENGSDNPRDDMLKAPGGEQIPQRRPFFGGPFGAPGMNGTTEPQKRLDSDLDEEVSRGDLDALFGSSGRNTMIPKHPKDSITQPSPESGPQRFQSFKSVSVRTYRNADGQIEERKTIQDGRGNKETVVSRSVGGKRHSVTTRRDHSGTEEVVENFQNMDETEKDIFNSQWNSRKLPPNSPYGYVIPPDAETRSIFRDLFGRGFPGFGGDS